MVEGIRVYITAAGGGAPRVRGGGGGPYT